MAAKDELGRAGEERAVAHLREAGYAVLDRNWRTAIGEIDVVAAHGGDLVFVEVKTRRSTAFGDPLSAVDVRKRARLWRLAGAWCSEHQDAAAHLRRRLDVIGITGADPAVGDLVHCEDVRWV